MRVLRGEKIHLRERLGFCLPKNRISQKSLWIHAVSVGEVLSLQNLIRKIKERHPEWNIYFSSLTNTGVKIAKEKLIGLDNIFFVPLDFKKIVRKFFKTLRPSVFVLAESEFWPNLLREASLHTQGVLLINGRISIRSNKRYSCLKFFMKKILNNIEFFLVQTKREKENLVRIGVDPESVEVAGNLKSEVDLSVLTEEEILKFKENLNVLDKKKVILAGSTRKGEEEQLIEAFVHAREKDKDILLIIAPRHLKRVAEIEKICRNYQLRATRRTSVKLGKQWDILILDTIGELAQFYALSDIAFVGGSLIPWGGHNLLEPAFYEKPVFFGPHMENFSYLAEKFVESGAAKITRNKKDLVDMFLIKDKEKLKEIGRKSKVTLKSLQGATDRTLKQIEIFMART